MSTAYYEFPTINKTLRNTFLMVALMMVPTIFGIIFGETSGINKLISQHPLVGFVVSIVILMAICSWIITQLETIFGFLLTLIFSFAIGTVISSLVYHVLHLNNGHVMLIQAIVGTMITCTACGIYAMTSKRDFNAWGGWLFGTLSALICVGLFNLFIESKTINTIFSLIAIPLFSAYFVYDINKIVKDPSTNYVLAAVNVYLDMINIFVNLLSLISDD